MNKKALIIGGGAVALVAIIVALIFIFVGGEDAYRSIKVFEIDGSCKVERDGDSLDAFKNMALSSGDSLTVGEGSFARLKLDDDKYVYLEANTKINLTATGTANDSKTMVYIERGSMLTEVKKKLSATSSYDIVTPNTTMSIRGTKTLTEVVEDVVTGHVQTSNAVLEGQVKIKAVKVKADGTVVSVERDLGAGEGSAFSSNKEELVSQEEMKSIADTGASVSGIKVEIVSEEDADVVFDVATFEASFLENVKSILIADAEAASGEGLSDEELDAINAQIDEAVKSLDVIREESQKAIDTAATAGDNTPTPVQEPVPETTSNTTPEPVPGPVSDLPTVTDDNDQYEGTTVIDGDTNLIDIGDDNDDEDDGTGNDTGTGDENDDDDEAGTDDNDDDENVDDGSDEENDEEDADNEDADEEDNAGDDEDEGDEEDADKEDEDKEDEEDEDKEDEEDEESGEERLAREEAERLEREAQEATEREAAEQAAREEEERLAREQVERDAQQSQSESGSGGGSTANPISYNDLTTEISFAIDPHTTASNYNVRVAFLQNSASSSGSSGSSGSDAIPMSSLPTAPEQGSILPGYPGSSYSAIVVPESESVDSDLAGSISSLYSFTGWYASEEDAASNDLSKRITTYSSNSANNLYPGISRVCSVVFMNYNEGYGSLVIPSSLPENIVAMDEYENDVVVMKVLPGTTITLPGAESNPSASDHPYISMNSAAGVNTSFYCYTTDYSADISGQYYAEGRPSVYEETRFYFPSDTITVSENDDFLMLYMQFISPVEIRVRTNSAQIKVRDMVSYPEDGMPLASLVGSSAEAQVLPTSISSSTTPQKWKISRTATANYDYLLETVYYGNSFGIPVFEGNTGTDYYKRDLLCSYRTSANGPLTTYNNTTDTDAVMFSPEEVDYKNPCKAAVRDGKYVFTVQYVDWVCINMFQDNDYGVENRCFKAGENNPFVIPCSSYEDEGFYKFAINPIDLYNNNGQPGGSTPAFGLTEIAGGSGFGKYIYAPDDIVYSWNSKGSTRGGAADDPTACYQASYLGDEYEQYSFVGVQGYRLAGFEIDYYQKGLNTMINKTFLLNERSEYEGLYYNAVPCMTAGTSYAVTNKLSLDAVWPDTFDMESNLGSFVTFTPIFVPVAPVTATLTYTEPNFSSRDSKTYLLGDYTLSLNTGTSNYGSVKNLDLSSIAIDYARIGVTNGFVSSGFRSSVGSYQSPTMQGQDPYYELYNNGVLSSGHSWMISHDSNDHIVLKEILTLLAVEDQAAITHYPFANIEGREEEENNTFIRGLKSVGQGSAPSTFTDYRPAIRKVVPAQGEECKYSCFFTRENNQIRFARVFTSSDSFYVRGSGSYSHFYGAITDLMGSDYLGSGSTYLGGYTSVYVYDSSTFCGTPTENDYMGIVNGVEVKRTTFDPEEDPSNIYSFLGLPSGHAGMFCFYNYTGVRIKNWDSAYAYCAGQWGNFEDGNSPHELFSSCIYYANMPEYDRRFSAVFDYGSQVGYPEGYINVLVANVGCIINIGIDQPGKAEVDYLTADQMNNLWTGTSGG